MALLRTRRDIEVKFASNGLLNKHCVVSLGDGTHSHYMFSCRVNCVAISLRTNVADIITLHSICLFDVFAAFFIVFLKSFGRKNLRRLALTRCRFISRAS